MRYIDADALKETIATNVYPVADFFNSRDYGMFWTGGIEKIIDEQPAADVAPVRHGRWAIHSFMPHTKYCSECEADSPYNKRWDFCPNCGAKNGGEV